MQVEECTWIRLVKGRLSVCVKHPLDTSIETVVRDFLEESLDLPEEGDPDNLLEPAVVAELAAINDPNNQGELRWLRVHENAEFATVDEYPEES